MAWLLSYLVIFPTFVIDASATKANPGLKAVTLSAVERLASANRAQIGEVSNELLQFKSKGHVLGFKEDRMYMVGMGQALIEEFIGARKTMPVGSSGSEGSKGAAQLQQVIYKDLWEGITLKYEANDEGYGIAVDSSGNLYVTGYSYAWNGPGNQSPLNDYSSGTNDDIVVLLTFVH